MLRNVILPLSIAAAAVAGLVWLSRRYSLDEQSFNPASPNNIVYQGANSIVQALTGDKNQTVGGVIHDTFNPSAGLATNERSPAPGIIITSVSQPSGVLTVWDRDDAEAGAQWRAVMAGFAETPGGAVSGRIFKP